MTHALPGHNLHPGAWHHHTQLGNYSLSGHLPYREAVRRVLLLEVKCHHVSSCECVEMQTGNQASASRSAHGTPHQGYTCNQDLYSTTTAICAPSLLVDISSTWNPVIRCEANIFSLLNEQAVAASNAENTQVKDHMEPSLPGPELHP